MTFKGMEGTHTNCLPMECTEADAKDKMKFDNAQVQSGMTFDGTCGLGMVAIAGIVTGSIAFLGLVIIGVICFMRNQTKKVQSSHDLSHPHLPPLSLHPPTSY